MFISLTIVESIVALCLASAFPRQNSRSDSLVVGRAAPSGFRSFAAPALGNANPLERRPLIAPPLRGLPGTGTILSELSPLPVGVASRSMPRMSLVKALETIEDASPSGVPALDFCPGDDKATCDYDSDHRVCAQFLDTDGTPLNWGTSGRFRNIEHLMPQIEDGASSNGDLHWNGGASKCINMTLTARLVQEVGCENMHIRCDATDLRFVSARNWWVYGMQGLSIAPAVNCLQKICRLEAHQAMSHSFVDGNTADWDTMGFSDSVENPTHALIARDASTMETSYKKCEDVTKTFSKTFYIGTGLMRPVARKHAWAIYAWCRRTDDIVDSPRALLNPNALDSDLEEWNRRLDGIWNQKPRDMFDLAMADTVREYPDLDIQPFRDMIKGMIMDVPGAKGKFRYESFDELYVYCYRVAGTVGLMMLPILGTADGFTQQDAKMPAIALGIALQLTNILRDVGEDLKRGRIYLPLDELRQFDITEEDLFASKVTEKYKNFLKFQIARARDYYKEAALGIPMLAPDARFAVRASLDLYGRILDKIEQNGYDNLNRRAYTTGMEKLGILPSSWMKSMNLASSPQGADLRSEKSVDITGVAFVVVGILAVAAAVRRRTPSISVAPMLG